MSPLTEPTRIILRNGWQPMDPDAAAYITAVETADGQALEEKVKIAIDNFVLGCKADGIWSAIKASCILAGARTLNGALVPLAGAAPTNYNFVSGDYNRKTGLVGNGSTKYLDSNRNNNADPRDSKHLAVYISSSSTVTGLLIGGRLGADDTGSSQLVSVNSESNFRINTQPAGFVAGHYQPGFCGASRTGSAATNVRYNRGISSFSSSISQTPAAAQILVFSRSGGPLTDARLAFYSIGESLDLALLDARVTDLINKFAEVIP